jgi:hypothetical protein
MEPSSVDWRTSTYSGPNGGACVEVGTATPGVVVRDTTDRAAAVLTIPVGAWRALLADVRADAQSLRPATHTTR